jgi:hypothetical protein
VIEAHFFVAFLADRLHVTCMPSLSRWPKPG